MLLSGNPGIGKGFGSAVGAVAAALPIRAESHS
jgi:hypothetical protein